MNVSFYLLSSKNEGWKSRFGHLVKGHVEAHFFIVFRKWKGQVQVSERHLTRLIEKLTNCGIDDVEKRKGLV